MKKATRQQARDHNTRLVLTTIFDQGELSRADIARQTGLTRPTVSTIVSDLLAGDFVIETGQGPSVGGKPPTILSINDVGRQLICLDLSGDEFTGALVDLRGNIRHKVSAQLEDQRGEAAVSIASALIDSLLSVASSPVLGIGLGTPGLVDPENGIVLRAVNLGWSDLPLRSRLEDRFGLPVHVANDSHLAALAEYTFGPEQPSRNLMVVRISQGIAAGIVINGQAFYGDGFGAGEIGHVVVAPDGERCTCGNRGCLETTSSARAMLHKARISGGKAMTDWTTFAQTVQAGHHVEREIAAAGGRYAGIAIAGLVGAFNIKTIRLAGRVRDLGNAFLEPLQAEMRRHVLPSMADATTVSYSFLERDFILLGGSALLLQRELGII